MKVIAKNRRARFDYDTSETVTAGIVLEGQEVKSVRNGHISLKGSFATIKDGEVWLNNAHISKYVHADPKNYDPTRSRKLLLKKREVNHMIAAKQNGMSIYPLTIGLSGKYIKIELGIGRGKRTQDKRQTIKKRDEEREINREIKQKT